MTSSSATSSCGYEDDSDASENDTTDAPIEATNDVLENIAADEPLCEVYEKAAASYCICSSDLYLKIKQACSQQLG